MLKQTLDRIELFMLCFTVFAIPIHIKLTSISIGFLVLTALLKKENYVEFIKAFKSAKFLILIIPYFVFWVGLIYSPHFSCGMRQVEIVTSLLLFPIIFTSYKTNSLKFRPELIQSFVIMGVIASYLICLSVAIPNFINTGDFDSFFYSKFSSVIKGPHHLSYYVLFAIILLVSGMLNKTPLLFRDKNKLLIKLPLLIICSVFLFQLSSKVTIILYFVFLVIIFGYTIKKKIVSLRIAIPIIITIAILSVGLYSLPKVQVRFNTMFEVLGQRKEIDYRTMESTSVRIAAYKAGFGLIKENFWTGVGTGELGYKMSDYYKKHDLQAAYIQHISPHNQFLRSFVMHGVFGFLSVLAMFVLMFYIAIKEKHFLMFFWTLMMFAIFNVEDILGIQDGIIFFCFYAAYFVLCSKETKISPEININLSLKPDKST